jgi:hydrogenase maturation protease
MKTAKTDSLEILMIGYGNPSRQDDGIGPYIVDRLKRRLNNIPRVDFLTLHQLTIDLVETVRHYDLILLIDATVEVLGDGFKFSRVEPAFGLPHYITHYFNPSLLLGLVQSIYHRDPTMVEVAIQGDSFGFRQKLTSEATARAEKAISEIITFVMQSLKCSNRNGKQPVFIDLNQSEEYGTSATWD